MTLFIAKNTPLHRLNPMTKLVFAGCIILINFLGPGFWLPSLLFGLVLLPLSWWAGLFAPFVQMTGRIIGPLALFLFIIHGLFNPAGRTELLSLGAVSVKWEGLEFAYLVTTRALTMIGASLLLVFTTHPGTLMIALAQRGVPASITYIIGSTLQIIPLMQAKVAAIMAAQRSRGLETEGRLITRAKALLPLLTPLVLGALVDVEERAIALEARAFNAKRPKTSLIEIPDSSVEHWLRLGLVALTLLVIGTRLWLSLK